MQKNKNGNVGSWSTETVHMAGEPEQGGSRKRQDLPQAQSQTHARLSQILTLIFNILKIELTSVDGTQTRMDHLLVHKTKLNKLKRSKISIECVLQLPLIQTRNQ